MSEQGYAMRSGTLKAPNHVPSDLVVDIDLSTDPALKVDIFQRLGQIRDSVPKIVYTPKNGGSWLVFSQKEQQHVLTNASIFSTSHLNRGRPDGVGMIPLGLDPPEHVPWRQLLNKHFGPAHVRALEPFVREWAERLIGKLDGATTCDFMKQVGEPMPVSVFMVIMGLPLDRFAEFRGLVVTALTPPDLPNSKILAFFAKYTTGAKRMMGFKKIIDVLKEMIADRRREPKDDLVSRLLAEPVKGRAVTDEEMMSMGLLLFLAGLDTVTNAMTYAIRHLARDQVLQEQVRNDRSLIPEVVEKTLRLYTFVNNNRLVIQDTELDGVRMKAGDMVTCVLWAGSNERGGETDGARHMAFGGGHHLCLGMHLARLEMRIMLETWFDHIGRFTLAPDEKPAMRGGTVMSISRLLLNLAPLSPAVKA